MTNFTGTSGDDTLTGTANADTFLLTQGGEDTIDAGGGADIIKMGGSFDAGDSIDGGGSNIDQLFLRGDYSGGVAFTDTTLTNVERIALGSGFDYNLTIADATIAATSFLTVDASDLGAGNALTFNGSADTDGHLILIGGAGNDVLTGNQFHTNFNMRNGGGEDTITGHGNDFIVMGANFDAGDTIDGGGTFGAQRSILRLDGDYSGGVTLGENTLANIYRLQFDIGFSYKLIANAASFLSGPTVTVDAGRLESTHFLNFDGSASDAGFHFIGGQGNDVLTGGTAADIFDLTLGGNDTANGGDLGDRFLMGATLTAADKIDGGAGNDIVELNGMGAADNITFTATTMVNVETLVLDAGHDYTITTADATVASGATLLVRGEALGAASPLEFNGSAETNGHFIVRGGTGNDVLTGGALSDTFNLTRGGNDTAAGGAGNDTFNMGAALNAADKIDGGADNDTVIVSGDYSGGLTFSATTMVNVENLVLGGGHNYKFTTNDATVASGDSLTVNMVALGAGHTLTLDASAETDGAVVVTAGAAFTAADSFIVGTGQSALILNGDYSGGLTFGATTAENLGDIELGGGFSYNITLNDATAAAGMAVDATALGAGDTLTLHAAAETNVSLNIFGGAGNDVLTGGQAGDVINISQGGNDTVHGGAGANEFDVGGALTAADSIDGGGGGGDYIAMNGDYTGANALVMGATTVTRIAELLLGSGNSYDITTNDATVANGATMHVDASGLGAGDTLTFNGAAETNGTFTLTGGAGNDVLTGGAAGNTFNGGGGADTMTAGAGADNFFYTAAGDSTSTTHDTIAGFNASADTFQFQGLTVGGFDGTVSGAVNSGANFDANIGAAFNDSVTLHGDHAWVVVATGGTLDGHSFLVVDTNNNAQYDGGTDYVIDITGFTGTFTAGDFV